MVTEVPSGLDFVGQQLDSQQADTIRLDKSQPHSAKPAYLLLYQLLLA